MRKAGGGLGISSRQAQPAKAFDETSYDVVGLHECRLPGGQTRTMGKYTAVFSDSANECDGCGLLVRSTLAQIRHMAVIHQEPSRLLAVVRAPCFAMNVMILHAPVEGAELAEAWWLDSARIARNLPQEAASLYFVDANARIGSVLSGAVGEVHADPQSNNGHFHQWMLSLGLAAYSTFRNRGSGATWRSSGGHLRRIDFICGSRTSCVVSLTPGLIRPQICLRSR